MALMLEGKSVVALMAILVLICCGVVDAQSDCASLIMSLYPCLGYVRGSGDVPPTTTCCTAFAPVVTNNATCLYEVLNGDTTIARINQTTALGLSKACNLGSGPISACQRTVAEVPTNGPYSSTVPQPITGGTPNSGTILTPSMVTISSMVGLIWMKDIH